MWVRIQQVFKTLVFAQQDMVNCSTDDPFALSRYQNITDRYRNLCATQCLTITIFLITG